MEVENVNIKKLFPEKKVTKKSLIEFIDKKGFYIVLVLCIAIVGATIVFITTHNITSSNEDFDPQKIISDDTDVSTNSGDKTVAQSSINSNTSTPAQNKPASTPNSSVGSSTGKQPVQQKQSVTTTSKPASPKPGSSKSIQKFIMPVFGDVSFNYAQETLVYSKTLEEWRTHSGVDIASDRGTPVKAVADGVISEIKSDPRLGAIILITHANGIKTVYANLANTDIVVPNQIVKQGEVIGSVGNTATFESAEQSHLHFEVLKNDEPVNPSIYLTSLSNKK